jgi:type II secretory pathway pseudopilin PulG
VRAFRTSHFDRGSVLLEVVLALGLFVGAATIITAGINASIQSTQRLRLQTHAVNLAISVMSEMQMHARPIAASGPETFPPPFQDWTCKIEINQPDNASPDIDALRPVEVIIRNAN